MRRLSGYTLTELLVTIGVGLIALVALIFGGKLLYKLWFLLDRI